MKNGLIIFLNEEKESAFKLFKVLSDTQSDTHWEMAAISKAADILAQNDQITVLYYLPLAKNKRKETLEKCISHPKFILLSDEALKKLLSGSKKAERQSEKNFEIPKNKVSFSRKIPLIIGLLLLIFILILTCFFLFNSR